MNYTNSSNRLQAPARTGFSPKPPTFLSLESGPRGLHLCVRSAATLARRKTGAFKLALAAVALGVCGLAHEAAAQTYFIQPQDESTSKDTKIYNSTPTSNFSSNLNLTSPDTGAFFSSLVQFSLATVPAGKTITNATLTLYCTGVGPSGVPNANGGAVTVQPITSGWSETTADAAVAGAPPLATYNAIYGTPPTITLGNVVATTVVNGAGFVTWDITSLAQQWENGTLANNGVYLRFGTSVTNGDLGFADVDSSPTVAGSMPSLTITVPEPSTTMAMIVGGFGLCVGVWRLRRTGARAAVI